MKKLKLLISILVMLALAVNKGRSSIPLKINTLCPVLLLYLVFFLSSNIAFAQYVWRKEDVKITGKIKNFEDKQTSMKIIVRDPLSQPFQDIELYVMNDQPVTCPLCGARNNLLSLD